VKGEAVVGAVVVVVGVSEELMVVVEGVEFSMDHLRRSDMLRSIVVVLGGVEEEVWRRLCLRRFV